MWRWSLVNEVECRFDSYYAKINWISFLPTSLARTKYNLQLFSSKLVVLRVTQTPNCCFPKFKSNSTESVKCETQMLLDIENLKCFFLCAQVRMCFYLCAHVRWVVTTALYAAWRRLQILTVVVKRAAIARYADRLLGLISTMSIWKARSIRNARRPEP